MVIDMPQRELTSLRIGPSQFAGLMIPDERWLPDPPREGKGGLSDLKEILTLNREIDRLKLTKPFVLRRVRQVQGILEKEGRNTASLGIYGTSGDLYWPQKIKHDDIVKMLAEKK